jgi:hypothetical protein
MDKIDPLAAPTLIRHAPNMRDDARRLHDVQILLADNSLVNRCDLATILVASAKTFGLALAIALPNLVLIWLVCWPLRLKGPQQTMLVVIFKVVFVLCIVVFDLFFGYALGKSR